jgi:putative addiction module killer protein
LYPAGYNHPISDDVATETVSENLSVVEWEPTENDVPPDIIEVRELVLPEGETPYQKWYQGLRDKKARVIIANRIATIRAGNLGDHKSVGKGVFELRIFYGPGYRIYFGRTGATLVILIGGGDKDSQDKDIITAQTVWETYKETINDDTEPS